MTKVPDSAKVDSVLAGVQPETRSVSNKLATTRLRVFFNRSPKKLNVEKSVQPRGITARTIGVPAYLRTRCPFMICLLDSRNEL